MLVLLVAVVLTVVALVRHARAWKAVVGGWVAMIALSLVVILPLQMRAQEELRDGLFTGSVLQNSGPLGAALGGGFAEVGLYRAQRLMAIANGVDLFASLALVALLVAIIARPRLDAGASAA